MIKWSEKNQDMAGTQAAMLRATRRAISEAKLRGAPSAVARRQNPLGSS